MIRDKIILIYKEIVRWAVRSASVGAGEQVVLAAQGDGPQGTFGGVVVCALRKVHGSPR
jgi:hypothetical protein